MNRKTFIHNAAAVTAASFFGVHDILAGCASSPDSSYKKDIVRITHLDLITGTNIEELKNFYTTILELPLLSEKNDRFMVLAGATTMSFVKTNEKNAPPFYHFAFNIPENKILKAREWQLKRTALSATPSHMVDSGYPDDVRHFRNWNAHSVFFWDPAGNLVEYIARHDLSNSSEGDFSSKDLLCASEIAFIVEETEPVADDVKSVFGLQAYKGGDANFRAMGDENGLLLLIKRGRVWESHTNISKTPQTIKTGVSIRAGKGKKWSSEKYPFEIIAAN